MEDLEIASIVWLVALLICWIIQLIYYWGYFIKPYKYQKLRERECTNSIHSLSPVSVIISGRNESQNLSAYLPSILEQNYPEYEVIFVNDASTDDTEDILKRFALKYPHFYHTYIPAGTKNLSRKKLALTLGIKAAKYDTLLFTEANAHPVSSEWIKLLSANITEQKEIVLGFTTVSKSPGKYISYDYFFSNLQMFSLALMKNPYMGDGNNLVYKKDLFINQRGFSNSNFLDAGEDDLFINEIANKENVAVELSADSIIEVDMAEVDSWKEFKFKRSVTKKFYKRFSIYFWRGEKISRIAFYLLFILGTVYFYPNWIQMGGLFFLFIVRLLSQEYIFIKTLNMLNQPKSYFFLPLFDFIQPFVDLYFYLYRLFKGRENYNWKYEKR